MFFVYYRGMYLSVIGLVLCSQIFRFCELLFMWDLRKFNGKFGVQFYIYYKISW